MTAEVVPPENVGQMHFDDRQTARQQSVQDRNGRVGISGGIDDNRAAVCVGLLNPRNDFAFRIALSELNADV